MRNSGGAAPARHILGNFELFEEIGRGGMGIVYRALDLSLDRIVAVKVLRDDLRSHSSIVSRFSREAKAAARLDHPHIVQIYSVGSAGSLPYIAMEYLDAAPLSAVLQREMLMEWRQALEIAHQIASALACAHSAHVIHRDIKPANILIDEHMRAYVTDFGIAKILTLDDGLTVDGSRLGTPDYMSPERCQNGEVSASSDLYSLGVLLFQMLTGCLPYEASSPVEMIKRILSTETPRVRQFRPDLPEEVERLVSWLMERQPRHRPRDGDEVCEAIERILSGKPLDPAVSSAATAIAEFRGLAARERGVRRSNGDAPDGSRRLNSDRNRPLYLALAAVLAASTLAGVGVGLAKRLSAPVGPAIVTPDVSAWFAPIPVANFSKATDSVLASSLNVPVESYGRMVWTHDGRLLVPITVTGQRGKSGWPAIVALTPDEPAAEISFAASSAAVRTLRLVSLAPAVPWHLASQDAFALLLGDASNRERNEVWLRTSPERPLERATRMGRNCEMLAAHPSGAALLASVRQDTGGQALIEYRQPGEGAMEEFRIVGAGPPIVAMQYAPNGGRIAYLRETKTGGFALRVVPSTGVLAEPAALTEGRITLSEQAMDSSGDVIVLASAGEDKTSELFALSTVDGHVTADLGQGYSAGWCGDRETVVLCADDLHGVTQLWLVDLSRPHERIQLTSVDAGVGKTCSVSPDGRWAAVLGAGNAGVVFVDLTRSAGSA